MPLTTEQKRELLQLRGLNPEEYDLDNMGKAVPRIREQPTDTPLGVTAKPFVGKKGEYGYGETLGRNVATSVGPGAAALAAGTYATGLAAPTGPFAPLIGLAVGLGTGYFSGKAQDKAIEQFDAGKEFLRKRDEGNAQNPKTALLGNTVGSLVTARANPTLLKDAGRIMMGGGTVGQRLMNPVVGNVAVGTGVSTGQNIYDQMQRDTPFSPSELALAAAAGAIVNDVRPGFANTAIGRKAGLSPYVRSPEMQRYEGGMPEIYESKLPPVTGEVFARPPMEQKTFSLNSPEAYVRSRAKVDKMARYKENTDDVEQLSRYESEGGLPEQPKPYVPPTGVERETRVPTAKANSIKQMDSGLRKYDKLYDYKTAEQPLGIDKFEGEGGKVIDEDAIAAKQKEVDEAKAKQAKFEAENEILKKQLEDEGYNKPSGREEIKPRQVTSKFIDATRPLAEQRGLEVQIEDAPFAGAGGIMSEGNITGNKIRVTRNEADNLPHEIGHDVINKDISGIQKKRLKKLIESDPDAADWMKRNNADYEEWLAQRAGEKDIERIQERDSSLIKDISSYLKVKTGVLATPEDAARYLNNKVAYTSAKPSAKAGSKSQNKPAVLGKNDVEYANFQDGFGKVQGFHMVTLKKALSDELIEGTTVSDRTLRRNGYEIDNEVIPRKPLPPKTRLTVQDEAILDDGSKMPGYKQIDFVDDAGNNIRSSNPDALAREGYDIPDLKDYKQGQHELKSPNRDEGQNKPANRPKITNENIETAFDEKKVTKTMASQADITRYDELRKKGNLDDLDKTELANLQERINASKTILDELDKQISTDGSQNKPTDREKIMPFGAPEYRPAKTDKPQEIPDSKSGELHLSQLDNYGEFNPHRNDDPDVVKASNSNADNLMFSDTRDKWRIKERIKELEKKYLSKGELDDLDKTEYGTLVNKLQDKRELDKAVYNQIGKSIYTKEGEAIPEVSKNKPSEQDPIGKKFPLGEPPYVGNDLATPRDNRIPPSTAKSPNFYKADSSSLKHFPTPKLEKASEVLLTKDEKALVKRYDEIVAKDNIDDLDKTELETIYQKIQDNENPKIKALKDQIHKLGLPKSVNEAVPEVSRNKAVNQEPIKMDETDDTKKGFFRTLEASFDKVERVSKPLAQAFRNWASRRDEHLGMRNEAMEDLSKFSPEDIDKTFAYHRAKFRGEPTTSSLNSTQEAISKIIKKFHTDFRDKQNAAGLKIHGRTAGKNEWYVSDMLSDKALDLFTRRPTSIEAKAGINDWVKHVMKQDSSYTKEEARKTIVDYIDALGAKRDNYRSVNFGALRKAQGLGLPESLREANAIKAIDKYARRAATDLAMFQELESKPEIAGVLKLQDPNTGEFYSGDHDTAIGAHNDVKKAMKWVTNSFEAATNPHVTGFIRVVNNALLGLGTGVRDIASVPVNSVPYIERWSDLGAFWKGIENFKENARDSLKTNARQKNLDKLQWGDLLDAPDRATETMNKMANALRKYQGRELLEQASRIYTFGIGKELARNNIRANNTKWLERFGTLVDVENIGKLKGQEFDDAVNKIAKNFTDAVQGTYDGRGLPTGVAEGSFAPFFALQKWGVEKSNTIYKDVIKPAQSGENFKPLLTYTLGSFLTGAAIQQLNELLTNRESREATLEEASAVGDTKHQVAAVITLMQLGSYGGIMSDLIKAGSDVAIKGKTPRNIVSFPTATAIADFSEKASDAAQAIRQGENSYEVATQLITDLITANIQTARMIGNHTFNEEKVKRSDEFRDLRVFRELKDKPTPEIGSTISNPYLDKDIKDFKKADEVDEIKALIPKIAEKIKEKAKNDPEGALRMLENLKSNNYQTMPSPDRLPLEFKAFYDFLVKTQGEDEAQDKLKKYLKQNALNRAKTQIF